MFYLNIKGLFDFSLEKFQAVSFFEKIINCESFRKISAQGL